MFIIKNREVNKNFHYMKKNSVSILDQKEQLRKEARGIIELAQSEKRELTEEEQGRVEEIKEEQKALDDELKELLDAECDTIAWKEG